jgi:hypothetical protein
VADLELSPGQHEGNRGALANQVESVALLAAPTRPADAARLLAAATAIRDVADAPMLAFERTESTLPWMCSARASESRRCRRRSAKATGWIGMR